VRPHCVAVLAALPLLAGVAFGDPLAVDGARARIGALFELDEGEARGLRVEVQAFENGPEGRRPMDELEAEIASLFAERGVPRTPGEAQPGELVLACRVGVHEPEPDDTGFRQVRWDGTCDLSRGGQVGLATARGAPGSKP